MVLSSTDRGHKISYPRRLLDNKSGFAETPSQNPDWALQLLQPSFYPSSLSRKIPEISLTDHENSLLPNNLYVCVCNAGVCVLRWFYTRTLAA